MCLREAVTNIVRHSASRHVLIHLEADGAHVHLTVSDDGRGLSARVPTVDIAGTWPERENSHGLKGIRARLAAVDGELTLWSYGQSTTGDDTPMPTAVRWTAGTTLSMRVPVAAPAHGRTEVGL